MKDYKRLRDRVIAEMLRNTEGESWDSDNVEAQCYIRLAELEDKIERGENDYVDAIETEQRITDLITEFDEMGFAPTTLHPNPEQYAIDWRDQVRKEFARLTAENDNLTVELEVAQRDVENLTRTLEESNEEIKALEAENDELRATLSKMETVEKELRERLGNAVELPCIEPMTTWSWDDTTGLGKNNFGKYWQVLYRDEDGEFIAYTGATKEEAEARLAELKGGKQ